MKGGKVLAEWICPECNQIISAESDGDLVKEIERHFKTHRSFMSKIKSVIFRKNKADEMM